MKARVIGTGEIIDLKGTSIEFGTATWIDCNNILRQGKLPNGDIELLEQGNPIDWEQVRINAAIAAMQAYIGNGDYVEHNRESVIAAWSVMHADALIEELKNQQS